MKICIDAGHNFSGFNTGAIGNNMDEQTITYYVADSVRKKLEALGITVVMTRKALNENLGYDNNSSLMERCKIANDNQCDLFVSIHCNAFDDESANGAEVYYYKKDAMEFANNVQKSIVKNIGAKDRGVKYANFTVLEKTNMPAILVELGFITSKKDIQYLRNFELCAGAVVEGVMKTVEMKKASTYEYIGTTHVVTTDPLKLGVYVADEVGSRINVANFVNGGYFGVEKEGRTYSTGLLADSGQILSDVATHGMPVTTLCVYYDGVVQIKKLSTLKNELGLKCAISGASLTDYASEGFTGKFSDIARSADRTYIGYRKADNKIVICVRDGTTPERALKTFQNLGVDDGITLDGGGSCCMRVKGEWKKKTSRRINNILMWED